MANGGKIFVPRFATERLKDGARSEPQPLSHWRTTPAYVLLGDPGAGKTTALKKEAQECGAQVASATDFGIARSKKSTNGTPYFIDALDEKRAGVSDADALNAIRTELVKLKNPSFRITCREIDWLGGVDTNALKAVSPNGEIVELHLEPLTDSNIEAMLVNWPDVMANPEAFWQHATTRGLQDWLRNPMALELFVKAVLRAGNGELPSSKLEIFQLATEQLATEFNEQHVASRRRAQPGLDQILEGAGKMFATLLLSNADGLTPAARPIGGVGEVIVLNAVQSKLGIEKENVSVILASMLFSTTNGQSRPYHRTIAEYLGAVAIGKLVEGGLPVSRVLALMSGQDGGIVEPLRGLHAWMAVTCPRERATLIKRDPLGVVMYGDVRGFSTSEKQQIFEALALEADRHAWFRSGTWNSHPFGALGTQDMVPVMQEILGRPDRGHAHQAVLSCVLDAICYGDKLPGLLRHLTDIIEDDTHAAHIRNDALKAWCVQSEGNIAPAREWLNSINDGKLDDPDDSLRGALLNALYPLHISPTKIVGYFSQAKQRNLIGGYRRFWLHHLLEKTPHGKFGELADAFVSMPLNREGIYHDFELPRILAKVIRSALEESDATEPASRIVEWLRTGRGNYDDVVIKGDDAAGIGGWLTDHPETLKRVYVELCLHEEATAPPERVLFWNATNFLYSAKYPRDWFNWLLKVAAEVGSSKLACFYFQRAAAVALENSVDFDIRMEDVEDWVKGNDRTWPLVQDWLTEVWSMPLTPSPPWQQEQFKREREYQNKRIADQQLRQRRFSEMFARYQGGPIGAGALQNLALAYRGRYTDIHGETPEARLQDLMGGGAAEVETALGHLAATLQRTDLPSVEDILASGLAGKEHFVRPACLIAANIVYAKNPAVVATWSEDLFKRLVAFWLTDGTDNEPAWYAAAIRLAPQWVADVMVPYAVQMIRKRKANSVTGLWALAGKDGLADLARIVVPAILEKFPVRANEMQLNRLVSDLLPAALRHLEPKHLTSIVNRRLENKSMDAGQRIAWLSIGTIQNNKTTGKALVKFIGNSQARVQHLLRALSAQVDPEMHHLHLDLDTQSLMIELSAPHFSPVSPMGGFWVSPTDNYREQVRIMIQNLSGTVNPNAGKELQRLRTLPQLRAWWMALDSAIFENTRLARAARFIHASPQAVVLMLANCAPANPGDLQALLVDHLHRLEKEIRGSDANLLGQFWTENDSTGQQHSQIENICRDRLLVLLRQRVQPLTVAVDKEAYAADDKRMDLRASIQGQANPKRLPIEIKKDTHDNVWTAWRDQLDLKYLNDPNSGGYGIYLVLWFGQKRTALDGIRPQSAKLMESMLREKIPVADRVRIAVVVMDLSNTKSAVQ